MIPDRYWDVVVIGAGPAGMAAALAAHDRGARVCIIEREERTGGILKQCIHDGFGLIRFRQRLTGPEYAHRFYSLVRKKQIPVYCNTFLLSIANKDDLYKVSLMNSRDAVFCFQAPAVVLATGCRERTAKQVFIHGTRPAGIMTAGLAQYFVNILGAMPVKKCLILGSGDIGLIMARRFILEGAEVEGVYEIKSEASGLTRNILQCLEDYQVPLHLNSTVTRVWGEKRVEAVTVCQVDADQRPIPGSRREVECDALILSVGLIPEIDSIKTLAVSIDAVTAGPCVDQDFMTSRKGLFACGNTLHVNDLVDYVSESGDIAGEGAAAYAAGDSPERELLSFQCRGDIHYTVPQWINRRGSSRFVIYFRSKRSLGKAEVSVSAADNTILKRNFPAVRPPEMERIELDRNAIPPHVEKIDIDLRGEVR